MNKITIQPGDTFTFGPNTGQVVQWRDGRYVSYATPFGLVLHWSGIARGTSERDITRADALVLLRVYGVEVVEETPMPVVTGC